MLPRMCLLGGFALLLGLIGVACAPCAPVDDSQRVLLAQEELEAEFGDTGGEGSVDPGSLTCEQLCDVRLDEGEELESCSLLEPADSDDWVAGADCAFVDYRPNPDCG